MKTNGSQQQPTRHALCKDTPLEATTHILMLICPILLVFTVTHATGLSSDMCSSVPQPDYAGLPTGCMEKPLDILYI